MSRALQLFTNLFPVWVLLGGIAALHWPQAFAWFRGPWIVGGLALIMLGMGITLELEDFRRVATMPRAIVTGFVGQYLIMPLLGWTLARVLRLETPLAVGLILVACCPGGTASNVVTYLAGAHVALSVLMTMCSTLAAVIFTPALTKLYAGAYVPVDAAKLLLDTAQVVLLPVLAGLALHHGAPRLVQWILPIAPPMAVVTIALICASILGQNADVIRHSGVRLLAAVGLLHAGGFGLGYLFAALFGFGPTVRRTISIEVGMQNSGLGTVLAQSNFPAMPTAALPGALSATCHSVLGSLLAGYWRLRPARDASPR